MNPFGAGNHIQLWTNDPDPGTHPCGLEVQQNDAKTKEILVSFDNGKFENEKLYEDCSYEAVCFFLERYDDCPIKSESAIE